MCCFRLKISIFSVGFFLFFIEKDNAHFTTRIPDIQKPNKFTRFKLPLHTQRVGHTHSKEIIFQNPLQISIVIFMNDKFSFSFVSANIKKMATKQINERNDSKIEIANWFRSRRNKNLPIHAHTKQFRCFFLLFLINFFQ